MDAEIEHPRQVLASDVLKEAVEEVTGRSNRKWAVVLVALVLGAVLAAYWIRATQHQDDDPVPAT